MRKLSITLFKNQVKKDLKSKLKGKLYK